MIPSEYRRDKMDIIISHHAFIRAIERKIYPDMIEATLKNGRIEKFGKCFVRFVMDYKYGTVVCIGERITDNKVLIKTIEWR